MNKAGSQAEQPGLVNSFTVVKLNRIIFIINKFQYLLEAILPE